MNNKCVEIGKNIIILLLSISFCIAATEITFRIALQYKPKQIGTYGPFQQRDYMTYDSLLGWKLKPNSKGTLITPEYQTRIEINSRGFRGTEAPYTKVENERRILILGDSFAEGYTVDLEDRFSNLLEKYLNATSKSRISVINLGVGGYSNDQELLQFQTEGRKYQADTVILLIYDNDIIYNVRNKYWRGSKPVFELVGDKLVLSNTPVPLPEHRPPASSTPQSKKFQRTNVQIIKAWLDSNSVLYKFIQRAVKDNYYLLSLAVAIGLTDKKSLSAIPEEFSIYAREYDAHTTYAWEVTERVIEKLDEDVTKTGAKLLVAYAPSRAGVYSEDWTKTRRKYGMSSDEWNINRVAAELTKICERSSIPFLDLTLALQVVAADLRPSDKGVYYERDPHWTPEGNVSVAHAMARFLKNRPLSPLEPESPS